MAHCVLRTEYRVTIARYFTVNEIFPPENANTKYLLGNSFEKDLIFLVFFVNGYVQIALVASGARLVIQRMRV